MFHKISTQQNIDNSFQQFYIKWQLISGCNYSCTYCKENGSVSNCIYIRSNLLTIAHKILSIPRPSYLFDLGGTGEITLYPHLHYLLDYLYNTNRNIAIRIHTNGSADLKIYSKLLNSAKKNSSEYIIYVHPAFSNIQHILFLGAMIYEKDQSAIFCLVHDPVYRKKRDILTDAVTKLRAQFQFKIKIWIPKSLEFTAQDNDWRSKLIKYHEAQELYNNIKPKTTSTQQKTYCCESVNFISINETGHTCTCKQNKLPWKTPLWNKSVNIDPMIEICNQPCIFHESAFTTLEKAQEYIDTFNRTKQRWRFDYLPIANPLNPTLNTEYIILSGLSRLGIINPNHKKNITSYPDLLQNHIDKLILAYDLLFDEQSKNLFLYFIQASINGNTFYFNLYLQKWNINNTSKITGRNIENNLFSGYIDTLYSYRPISVSMLKSWSKSIRLHAPKFKFMIKPDIFSFLEVLNFFQSNKKGYHLYLSLDNNKNLWLTGIHPGHLSRYNYKIKKNIRISLIVTASHNIEIFKYTLTTLLNQCLTDHEIIVILHRNQTTQYQFLREIQKYLHSNLYIVYTDITNYFARCIEISNGRYIGFIDSNDIPTSSLLIIADKIITSKKPDILSFNYIARNDKGILIEQSRPETFFYNGHSFKLYDILGVSAKFYRKSILRLTNKSFVNIGEFSGGAFNFSFILNARSSIAYNTHGFLKTKNNYKKDHEIVHDFIIFSDFISKLLFDMDIDPDKEDFACFINLAYNKSRKIFYNIINRTSNKNNNSFVLSNNHFLSIGKCKYTLNLILSDYAETIAIQKNLQKPLMDKKSITENNSIQLSSNYIYFNKYHIDEPLTPTLSIIIPNYNKESYLEECLNSILTQSFVEFELLIIDDASTDASWHILQNYAQTDNRIRLWRRDNNGLQGACRNFALNQSRGKWIIFIDSDDMITSGFLETGIAIMEKQNADIGLFSHQYLHKNGEIHPGKILSNSTIEPSLAYQKYVQGEIMPVPWAKIFNRDFIQIFEIKYPEGIYFEDQFFISQAIKNARHIISSEIIAYTLRLSQNSSMRPNIGSYNHIHSACHLFNHLKNAEELADNACTADSHFKWNLEEVMLPIYYGLKHKYGKVKLLKEDYDLLKENVPFLRNLIYGLSNVSHIYDHLSSDSINSERLQFNNTHPKIIFFLFASKEAKFLADLLDSILNLPIPEIAIKIINHDSKDFNDELIKRFVQNDSRIEKIDLPITDLANSLYNYIKSNKSDFIIIQNENVEFYPRSIASNIFHFLDNSIQFIYIYESNYQQPYAQSTIAKLNILSFLKKQQDGEIPTNGFYIFKPSYLLSHVYIQNNLKTYILPVEREDHNCILSTHSNSN